MKESSINKPSYLKPNNNEDLFLQLRRKVNETVRSLESERKSYIWYKAVLFPALYILIYISALIWGGNTAVLYTCYFFLGFFLVIIFLNLIHEAVHNTLFKNKAINKAYIYFFDVLGANSYIWKIRHVRLHHAFPNVMGWDSDFEQSPIVRVFPHGSFSKYHKYQHIYLPFLYPFYLFNWLLIRDFKDFFDRRQLIWKVADIPKAEFVKLFIFKLIFIFYILILPKIILPISWEQMIIAFLIMMFSASILSLIVLLSPHANQESEFPMPDEQGKMSTTWFNHQLSTTNDVVEDNWFTRFFLGCFNYHIAHHLFPSVHHVYYPEITEEIRKFAADNGLPYRKFPLRISLLNHYRLLKSNAEVENIFEETM